MKIGIFDPYLDTLGGGERYIFSLASYLSQENTITIFWDDTNILKSAEDKFNLPLKKVKTTQNIFAKFSFLQKRQEMKQYDSIIFMSDGSIPFLFSKQNILIFQFPVNWVNGKSLQTKFKLKNIKKFIVYSQFVKNYIDDTFNTSSIVIPPAVDQVGMKGKKENMILSVGRFTKDINAKKQEVMIEVFKKLSDSGLKDWQLILIGSFLKEDKDFVEDLQKKTKGYPIKIITNASYSELVSYYQKAKIYWHAAGFGENLEKHPERAEHFGITTVEAMSAGCVPVVIAAGGQPEIVDDGKNGLLWSTIEELQKKTLKAISDQHLWHELSENAVNRAKDYSPAIFEQKVQQLYI